MSNPNYYIDLETNHFGYGTSSNTDNKTLKQKEIAASITLSGYHRRMVMICRCFPTRERYTNQQNHKHIWIKKSRGIGVTEFLLRYISYCCTLGKFASNTRVCVVTGPRIDLAEDLIARFKGLFGRNFGQNDRTASTVAFLSYTTERELANKLKVSDSTIHKDFVYLREQTHQNFKTHIQDRLPAEYECCLTGMNQVLKMSWDIANGSKGTNNGNGQTITTTATVDNKTRLQALALVNDCYKYIMDLTTNGVVITDAIKFVQANKEKLTMSSKEDNNGSKESNEPDYDEDKDQLEEGQEEETGEINQRETTNQVF